MLRVGCEHCPISRSQLLLVNGSALAHVDIVPLRPMTTYRKNVPAYAILEFDEPEQADVFRNDMQTKPDLFCTVEAPERFEGPDPPPMTHAAPTERQSGRAAPRKNRRNERHVEAEPGHGQKT